MLKKILIGLVVLIALFVVVVALRPNEFAVTRSTTVAAPPAAVFEHVNDYRKWDTWSPWEKLDPQMKRTYEGPPAGKGAVYSWTGNDEVGEGRMTITESKPSELILIKLEFKKPFESTNVTEFTFKPQGEKTVVTWTMSGPQNFMCKAIGLFMNMDAMVGGQFEQGLAKMKTVAEAATKK